MLVEPPSPSRTPRLIRLEADLTVVGGGMAGLCCAITAARAGIKVVLIQDRPVLGGNASSEIRLWVLGATCHMGSNNRWAREGGVIDELLVENLWRNPEGNPLIFDTIILEWVTREPNITLLLNTAVFEAQKTPDATDRIAAVHAFCSQNSTLYHVNSPLFADASGDGILGFLAGAAFRMGAESRDEFAEPFAPTGEFGHLLGHSIYFYSKDTGRPVNFVAPAFALKNVPERIPRYRSFNATEHGCRLWWIEWGGRLDTVHETETIKWELWKVVYGVWDYIKNSGKFPEAQNLTLEWVGHIPGKRESRRFEGPYMLRQQDVVTRPRHDDAVAFGGWSIDLHPADGVFSNLAGSHHLHSKGIYSIPFRCYYSRNIPNLFFAGRIISVSHVAFGTTRVMGTGAHGGQAVAIAASLCRRWNCLPADISAQSDRVQTLQRELLRTGQHIPGYALEDPSDLARTATITASSRLLLGQLPADGPAWKLDPHSVAQLIPLLAGPVPQMTLQLDVAADTTLAVELRTTSRPGHHTPDVTLAHVEHPVRAGTAVPLTVTFDAVGPLAQPAYVFVCLMQNPLVHARCTTLRATGLLSVRSHWNEKTSHVGGEDYEVWTPVRRPAGHNLAIAFSPPVDAFSPASTTNGVQRPTHQSNAWVADPADPAPTLTLTWDRPQTISRVELFFDPDYDHAMESVLMGQPERAVPFCVKHFRLLDDQGQLLAENTDNHQARNIVKLAWPVTTRTLTLQCLCTHGGPTTPASVFEIRCYGPDRA